MTCLHVISDLEKACPPPKMIVDIDIVSLPPAAKVVASLGVSVYRPPGQTTTTCLPNTSCCQSEAWTLPLVAGWLLILARYLASDISRAERGRGVTTNIFEPPSLFISSGAVAVASHRLGVSPSLTFERWLHEPNVASVHQCQKSAVAVLAEELVLFRPYLVGAKTSTKNKTRTFKQNN